MGIATRITRRYEWDSGHRVLGHEGKCKHLHGHRYVAEITVEPSSGHLDDIGRVVDFSVMKTVVGRWIDDNWDHNFISHEADPLLDLPPEASVWAGKKPFIMPSGMNPTAEYMSRILFFRAEELLSGYGIKVVHVRLYETPNCWADFHKPW